MDASQDSLRGAVESHPSRSDGHTAPRRRRLRRIALLLIALVSFATTWLVIRGAFRGPSVGLPANGLPATYAMACRICKARFDMPTADYQSLLVIRSDKSGNCVTCPKCGAANAAFRRDSGMAGLDEIHPDAAVSPRLHSAQSPR